MPPQLYKFLLASLAVLSLIGGSFIQRNLVHDRDELGLTRYTELKGAPPMLALTTVALGGFRGLISNALWIRANELQEEDKFFEMVQLADWITKLEPHFTQVWLVQAWNMAYNISVKFKDPQDRWRWVRQGIVLLRDDGLRYNPNDVLIYRELAWIFQHKMGFYMDDAHMYYKRMWANEMAEIFGVGRPNWDELVNPKTDEGRREVGLLRDKYKMDPQFMKEVDDHYGPLEWKLPDAHAIYWAALGLREAGKNVKKFGQTDIFITLRRVIYQTMQLTFQRGKLILVKEGDQIVFRGFGPNLDIIPSASRAYEEAMNDDPKNRDHIETAHRNFLLDAVFFLYVYNKQADAIKWYKYIGEKYPDKGVLDGIPNSFPRKVSLEDYGIHRINMEIKDLGPDKTKAVLEGLVRMAFESLAYGDDDKFNGFNAFAEKMLTAYNQKAKVSEERLGMETLPSIRTKIRDQLLVELAPELAAQLRTRLGMPPPSKAAPPENSPDKAAAPVTPGATVKGTNAPAALPK